jgi:hypothetical protein
MIMFITNSVLSLLHFIQYRFFCRFKNITRIPTHPLSVTGHLWVSLSPECWNWKLIHSIWLSRVLYYSDYFLKVFILYKLNASVLKCNNLYSSPNIIRMIKSRRMRWPGRVARMGETRNAYRILVGEPEGKRPLGRPRRRWVDNIQMDLVER